MNAISVIYSCTLWLKALPCSMWCCVPAFDNIIGKYDVYQVETIGDSYMCVSGVPERNFDKHANEIATMSLDILHTVFAVSISDVIDNPQELQVRIGLNSGPLIACVVGLKRPRYCLFGDTGKSIWIICEPKMKWTVIWTAWFSVNMALLMQSSSLPMRIQITEATKRLLISLVDFRIIFRGTVRLKVSY